MKNKIFGMLATIMIVYNLMMNLPITGTQTVAGIPTVYSKITVITKDDL